MENLLLLILCFALGLGLRQARLVDDTAPTALNVVIIYVALPALALLYTHDMPIGPELLAPAAMAWLVFGLGCAFFFAAGRILGWDRQTVACLCLVGGLGNTSFVGLPMIEAFFGPEHMGVGMLCDQAGTFLALAVPGIVLAARASGRAVTPAALAWRILAFPPFLALVLGFALQPVPYPDWLTAVLSRLGALLSPLALISVGMTLKPREVGGSLRELGVGLAYKLVLAPLAVYALYMGVMGLDSVVARVTVFEAAMGPMVTAGIIAVSYGLRPALVGGMLGLGIPLSFLTVWLWYLVLA